MPQGEILTLAGQGSVSQPLISDADIIEDGVVNLLDFVEVAKIWLFDEIVWP